ncbi:hypothetical protein C8024_10695 [Sphingopyxis sp. BSNA05]|uniref:hypothetical protein n=1 Tax=Sphingopyxis sp. BSNA05 TaxID=1236614 RepID=UPI00156629C2|nr:hypothetical protein [Sphingopyxis sp. BSNA05]NRD89820.1 hypothetical protein [Sphingopyxis sp. BSNA05]
MKIEFRGGVSFLQQHMARWILHSVAIPGAEATGLTGFASGWTGFVFFHFARSAETAILMQEIISLDSNSESPIRPVSVSGIPTVACLGKNHIGYFMRFHR